LAQASDLHGQSLAYTCGPANMGCAQSPSAARVQAPQLKHSTTWRIPCRDGRACADLSANHRVKFSHPGDHDYHVTSSSSSSSPPPLVSVSPPAGRSVPDRPSDIGQCCPCFRAACKYGGECKDLCDEHRSRFSHPGDLDWIEPTVVRAFSVGSTGALDSSGLRKACKFGLRCFQRSVHHTSVF